MNNEEKKEILITMLKKGKSNKEIVESKLFNTYGGMRSFCNRNKIYLSEIRTGKKNEIRKFNEDFLGDLEFKYYFSGLIASDGTIDIDNRKRIRLCLKDDDVEILDKIGKHVFASEYKLYKKSKILQDGISISSYLEIHISNMELVDFMLSIGITNAKTKTMDINFDNFSNKNIVDFMRGYFDGDGSVTFSEYVNTGKKYLRSRYIGNKNTMDKISNILKDNNIKHTLKDITKEKYTFPFYQVEIGSIEDNLKFYNYLYSDNPKFFLKRKFDKFNEVISK